MATTRDRIGDQSTTKKRISKSEAPRTARERAVLGKRSIEISARVDPGVLRAAAERLGLDARDVSDVVNASLAVVAAPDRFKVWLRNTKDTLPDDFEAAI